MAGIRTVPAPECPDCGRTMKLRGHPRKPGQSWDPFWGCPQYPKCTGTRNIDEDGNPETDEDIEDREMDVPWRTRRYEKED